MSEIGVKTEYRAFPVYTNEEAILQANVKPMYILAGRFRCFQLKVKKNELCDEKIFAYLIAGENMHERVFLYLTFDHQYDLVTKVRLHRGTAFDSQLGMFLGLALITKLKEKEVFTFAKNAIPFLSQKKLKLTFNQ